MKESSFVKIFQNAAEEIFKGKVIVESKSNLLYELYLNEKLEVSVVDIKKPKRGYSAFQTDICIYENINQILVPRIAIEFKTKITTHDVLTYSAKAGKHKIIYPSLRYGLIASEIDSIPPKFFIHNDHIDFFVAAEKYKTDRLKEFIKKLIEAEIASSKALEKLYLNEGKFNYYRANFTISNL
ncbi:hypothetical protein [Mucilaginibacter lappiensis]|uniref:Uncharacterized protein n=1 Tax=Mucilaginibacter lappiensis TaxID=354630 RepID=A0A841JC26_9SPHI|nr:hypothetical protein [Mucilaginibacter lappiensis]MBB6128340.1 hypothetical protein [Mucilaginibacter lappiensis]